MSNAYLNTFLRLSFSDEDILSYEPPVDLWAMYFDGSNHGLGSADLEDFEILPDGDIIFTLDKAFTIPALGGVDDSDVVRFDSVTGTYSLFLAGADMGLTKGDEDIDAFACTTVDCTTLLISTIGRVKANGVNGDVEANDEDLLACDVEALTCQLFFDGSDVALTSGSEDVDAAWLNTAVDGSLWLTTKGNFFAEGSTPLGGDSDDIFGCAPDPALGADTDCFFFEVFNSDATGLSKNIDGLWATYGATPPQLAANMVAADSQAADTVDADDAIGAADFAEAASLGDPEIDAYDFINVVKQIYLPAVNR